MTEDRLLKELGELARQESEVESARLDERWDRLAAGTLSPEEEEGLRALAATSPEAREAYEAFRPLGTDFQARVVAAAAAELARGPAPQAGEGAGPREPPEPRGRLLSFRRATLWIEVGLGSAAVAAAALFMVLRSPALPPLPTYTAELSRGDQVVRGGEHPSEGLPVFSPGSLLTLVAKPQPPTAARLEARAFFGPASGDGQITPFAPEPEIHRGFVRFRGTLGREIQIPPGTWKVWLVVGRPRKLPSASDLREAIRSGRTRQDRWQAVSAELEVRAPP